MKQIALPITFLGFETGKFVRGLVLIVGVLVIFHLINVVTHGASIYFERFFDLDREASIPTWFANLLLIISAILSFDCFRVSRSSEEKVVWLSFTVLFLFLSCDEVAMFHENIAEFLRHHIFKWESLERFGGTTWPLMVGPFVAIPFGVLGIGLFSVLSQTPKARGYMGLGILIYFSGAIGAELLNLLLSYEPLIWIKKIEIVLEESFEMLGLVVVIKGLLTYVQELRTKE